MKHPLVKLAVVLLIMVGALYLAFRGVDFNALLVEVKSTNILLIVAGTLLLFCSHVARAWRWKIILRSLKPHTSVWTGWKAIMGAYAMNNVIPRSGELIRPYIFAKHEKVFMSGTIATILVERVVDLLSNILFFVVALIVFPREIAHGFPSIGSSMMPLMFGGIAIFILVIVMIFSANKTSILIKKISSPLPEKVRTPIHRAANEFASALRAARASGAGPVALGTAGIWVFYVLSMYVWLFAFPNPEFLAVGLIGAFFLRVVSGFALMIPTPGGMGTYHFFISQALANIFSVPLPLALAYATITHAAQYIGTTVIGLIIVLAEGISLKNFKQVVKASEDHSPKELEIALNNNKVKLGALGVEERVS